MTKTCFIIGNGPSFLRAPMDYPEDVQTFGMNYCGFQPDYYVCIDQDVITKNADKIRPLVQGAKVAFLSVCFSARMIYTTVQTCGSWRKIQSHSRQSNT